MHATPSDARERVTGLSSGALVWVGYSSWWVGSEAVRCAVCTMV